MFKWYSRGETNFVDLVLGNIDADIDHMLEQFRLDISSNSGMIT